MILAARHGRLRPTLGLGRAAALAAVAGVIGYLLRARRRCAAGARSEEPPVGRGTRQPT
jgi:hypothetical protein